MRSKPLRVLPKAKAVRRGRASEPRSVNALVESPAAGCSIMPLLPTDRCSVPWSLADAARREAICILAGSAATARKSFPWLKPQSRNIAGERLQPSSESDLSRAVQAARAERKEHSRASGGTLAILMMAVRSFSAKGPAERRSRQSPSEHALGNWYLERTSS